MVRFLAMVKFPRKCKPSGEKQPFCQFNTWNKHQKYTLPLQDLTLVPKVPNNSNLFNHDKVRSCYLQYKTEKHHKCISKKYIFYNIKIKYKYI